jgi:hypothetical protein
LEIDMRDVREAHFFIRDGRKHVEEWIGFLLGHSQLLALVPVFQDGLSLEDNVRNLAQAANVKVVKWTQRCYIYSGDVALLVLVGLEKDRKAFVAHLEQVREQYNQKSYVLWDSNTTVLVTAEGPTALPDFTGSLDSVDELAGYLILGFKTEGQFNGSMSYVQMRDHQTRPRPQPGDSSPQ